MSATPLYRRLHGRLRRLAAQLRGLVANARRRLQKPAWPEHWDHMTYTEKLAWRCLNPDPRVDYAVWADKTRSKQLLRGVLPVPATYQVIYRPPDIDPANLPGTYVMKATHGWNMAVLVRNGIVRGGNRSREDAGRRADRALLQGVAENWLTSPAERDRRRRERHYLQVQPGIMFEQFLDGVDCELQLFLFHGRCRFALVLYRGFFHDRTTHRLYDQDWNLLEPGDQQSLLIYETSAPPPPRPPSRLLNQLRRLCRKLDHVRADLYLFNGQYYFSEFTFTHNAGRPSLVGRYDRELGRFWLRD